MRRSRERIYVTRIKRFPALINIISTQCSLLIRCQKHAFNGIKKAFCALLNSIYFITLHREVLCLKDGGEVALDWLITGCADDAPLIIILPGLTGESQAEYIKCLVAQANAKGIKCVVFNNRGLGGVSLKTPRLYCAANCEDLSEVVNHVHKKYPNVKKGATGISMGGLILGKSLDDADAWENSFGFVYRQLLSWACRWSKRDHHSS